MKNAVDRAESLVLRCLRDTFVHRAAGLIADWKPGLSRGPECPESGPRLGSAPPPKKTEGSAFASDPLMVVVFSAHGNEEQNGRR